MIDYYEPNIDLTLYGCGFIGTYHFGAICLLSQIWPQKPFNRICGASCGGLIGGLLLAGYRLEQALLHPYEIAHRMRNFLKNPTKLIKVTDLVEQQMEKALPDDAHKLCSGKLGISLTKQESFENKIVSKFNSRRDLIDALTAGSFIPFWSGSLKGPKFMGETYIDGAYSNNTPRFELTPEEKMAGVLQIDICPFGSKVQVSPPDSCGLGSMTVWGTKYYVNWKNVSRCIHAMLPHHPCTYEHYLINGHQDMKEFILNSGLIKCFNCHQEKKQLQSVISEVELNRKACLFCLKLLEKVDSLKVPHELSKVLDS